MTSTAKKTLWGIAIAGFLGGIITICCCVTVVNYMGTDKFCSSFCHTMNGVAYAWKQGSHARNASGVTAGCSDCHLYNASEPTLGPIGYVSLLGHKLVAGSHSLFGQIIGRFHTPTEWMEQRPGVEKNEIAWFKGNNYHTCRGCHDLTKINVPGHPGIGAWHAIYQTTNQPLDCLNCHKDVGHNYTQVDEYIQKTGKYPPLEDAWKTPDATSSASLMPPINPTPEQLAKAQMPYVSANSSASKAKGATAAPAVVNPAEQTEKVEKEALELNKVISEPIGTQPITDATASSGSASSAAAAPATKVDAPSSASTPKSSEEPKK